MKQIKQFLTLTSLTILEAIRQPICLLLATTCIVLISLVPIMVLYNFGEDGKLVRDAGLAVHFVFGMFLASYVACSSISKEIKRGTVSTVLSKPVSRDLLFLSKSVGIAIVVIAFSLCASISTLLSERVAEKFYSGGEALGWQSDKLIGILLFAAPFLAYLIAGIINYRFKRPFESTAFITLIASILTVFIISAFFDVKGDFAPFHFRAQWRILPASYLITIALIVLSTIAITISTRLTTVPTLILTNVILMLGLSSDYLFGTHATTSSFASFLYGITPNWQHFWLSDALNAGGQIPRIYLFHATTYAILYSLGIVFIGMFSFRFTEMK